MNRYVLQVFTLLLGVTARVLAQDNDLPVMNTDTLVTSTMQNNAMQNTLPEEKRDTCFNRHASPDCQKIDITTRAGAVKLPSGWTATAPVNGISTVTMTGSDDAGLYGIIETGDAVSVARKVVAMASPSVFTVEKMMPMKRLDNGINVAIASLRFADGRTGGNFVYTFARPDGRTALTALVTANIQDNAKFTAQLKSLNGIMRQLMQSGSVPKANTANTNTAANAALQKPVVTGGFPPPRGVPLDSVGGTFVPGKYVGKQIYRNKDTGKVTAENDMTLYLFENGEYALAGKDENYGRPYSVNAAKGELDLKFGQAISFFNSSLNPGEDMALYGMYQGIPTLFGRTDMGFSDWITILVRQGPPGRLSPSQAAAKAEADEDMPKPLITARSSVIVKGRPIGAVVVTRNGFSGATITVGQTAWFLFANGIASSCTNAEMFDRGVGLDVLRQRKKCSAAQWRRSGNRIDLMEDGEWEVASREGMIPPLPQGFRLNYTGETKGGAGFGIPGSGVGATHMVFGGDISFTSAGKFGNGSYSSMSFSNDGPSTETLVTAGSSSNNRGLHGQYRIDGYVLTVTRENGTSVRRYVLFDKGERSKYQYAHFEHTMYWLPD